MKTLIQIVIPVFAATLLAGCTSANYQKGSATGAGLQDSADRMHQGAVKIDTTLTNLNDMVNNPGDLAAQFKKYTASVADLESSAKNVEGKVASMRGKGNEYFNAWDAQTAQIKNEDIKQRSAARKAEMQHKFTDIRMNYTKATEQFKPFLADLKDIQTALATDLTVGGVNSIKGAADKANKDAVPLKATIEDLAGQFKDLGVAMQTGTPQAPPPATQSAAQSAPPPATQPPPQPAAEAKQ
jgi:hypothetical protein